MRCKGDLPTKVCAACARPFSWRKKWARDWEAVRFCSERCRNEGTSQGSAGRDGPDAVQVPLKGRGR